MSPSSSRPSAYKTATHDTVADRLEEEDDAAGMIRPEEKRYRQHVLSRHTGWRPPFDDRVREFWRKASYVHHEVR